MLKIVMKLTLRYVIIAKNKILKYNKFFIVNLGY